MPIDPNCLFRTIRRSRKPRRARSVPIETLEVRTLLTPHFGFAAGYEGGQVQPADVQVEPDGDVISVGSFTGTVDFDPGPNSRPLTSASGLVDPDGYITRLDGSGGLVAAGQFASTSPLSVSSVATDRDGSVYVAGQFSGPADMDPGPGTAMLQGRSGDAFVVKLDADLNLQWARRFGGSGRVVAEGIGVDRLGNAYVGGWFSQTIDFDPRAAQQTRTASGARDAVVFKLDTTGQLRWVSSFAGTAGKRGAIHDVDVTRQGDVFVVGAFAGSVDFDPQAGASVASSLGGTDAFVARLDHTGDMAWVRVIGNDQNDSAQAVSVNPHNLDVYFSATHAGIVDVDPGPARDQRSTARGQAETFFTRIDAAGEHVWTQQLSESRGTLDVGSLAVAASGAVTLTGKFSGRMDFDPGNGGSRRRASEQGDAFVGTWRRDGQLDWVESVASSAGAAIGLGANGVVVTSGTTDGADFDSGPGQQVLNRGAYVWKHTQSLDVILPGNTNDVVVRRKGSDVQVYDRGNRRTIIAAPLVDTPRLNLDGSGTTDLTVTVDHDFGGIADIFAGIHITAGAASDFDRLVIVGTAGLEGELRPVTATPELVRFTAEDAADVWFLGADQVQLEQLDGVTIRTTGAADVLDVSGDRDLPGGGFSLQISGAVDSGIAPVQVRDTPAVVVRTNAGDDRVTLDQASLRTRGLRSLVVETGSGADTIEVRARDLSLDLAADGFAVAGGSGEDTLQVRGNTDYDINSQRVASGAGGKISFADVEAAALTGGVGDNRLDGRGFSGQLTLSGEAGDDRIVGSAGGDVLNGGSGDDSISGREGPDQIRGGDGDDSLLGQDGNDVIDGGSGNDLLDGADGNDTLSGGAGDDQLFGGSGNDGLSGDAGADLFGVDATDGANRLSVRAIGRDVVSVVQTRPGLSTELQRDVVEPDEADELFVRMLAGDDFIEVADDVRLDGFVDGGSGVDECQAPASWRSIRCS